MKMACCSYWQDHFGSESISASWHFICSPRTGDVAPRIVAVRSSAKRHCEEAGSGSIEPLPTSDAVLPNFFGCPALEDDFRIFLLIPGASESIFQGGGPLGGRGKADDGGWAVRGWRAPEPPLPSPPNDFFGGFPSGCRGKSSRGALAHAMFPFTQLEITLTRCSSF